MRVAELAVFSCVWLFWLYLVVFCCRTGLCRCGFLLCCRLWNLLWARTGFRTTAAEGHGIFSKYLLAFVPRWRKGMEFLASINLLSYHAAGNYGIFGKFLPAFVPRWSGYMEPEASFYLLSYHAAGNYGIFCKYPSGLVPLYRQPGCAKGNTLRRKVPTPSPPPQNSGHQPADTQYIPQLAP